MQNTRQQGFCLVFSSVPKTDHSKRAICLVGMVSEKLINAAETLCTFELQTWSALSFSVSFYKLGADEVNE